jgi:hypothetical protein
VQIGETMIFQTCPIKDLDRSPCKNSTTVVVDFDKSKERIVNHLKLSLLCSCDALIIDSENCKIDFIELKSLNNILKYNKFDNENQFKEKILSLHLKNKIVESDFLIQAVINHQTHGFTGAERISYTNIEKRYIIVFDFVSEREYVFGSFAFLGIREALTRILELEIRSSELHNIGSPILKTCATIDKFYQA